MATRTSVSIVVDPDVTGDVTVYGTERPQAMVTLTPGPTEPWDPYIAAVHASDPDGLVKFADMLLEAAELLRAVQREQVVAGSEAA